VDPSFEWMDAIEVRALEGGFELTIKNLYHDVQVIVGRFMRKELGQLRQT
jgi:hypothetical protein